MKKSKIERVRKLLVFTLILAILQSMLLHIGTTCNAHNIFSSYFFIELFIVISFFFWFEKKWYYLLLTVLVAMELVVFIKHDLPFTLLDLLVPLAFFIRVFAIYKLYSIVNCNLKIDTN